MFVFLDLLARTVGLVVVVGGVGEESVGLALDQRRSLAGAGSLARLSHRRVARQDVVAVHDGPGDAVAGGPGRDVLDRHLLGLRHTDRVLVVLADEDHRDAVDRGEIHSFVPIALAGRALPEPAPHDRVLFPVRDRVRDPGGVGDLRRDGGGVADDPQRLRSPVRGHLTAARGRVVRLREEPEEHLDRRHARTKDHAEIAVVRHPHVRTRSQRPGGADLAPLMTGDRDDERRPSHPVLPERGLVDQPRQQHRAVHRQEVFTGETE